MWSLRYRSDNDIFGFSNIFYSNLLILNSYLDYGVDVSVDCATIDES
jgi:hypothetical protein